MNISLHRVSLLFKKQLIENTHFYLLGLLAMMGVMGLIFIFTSTRDHGFIYEDQRTLLFVGMVFCGGLFTVTILSQFSNKTQGIQALILPVSAAEKILMAIIFSLIIFPIVYIGFVYPVLVLAHYIDIAVFGNINPLFTMNMDGHLTLAVWFYVFIQTLILLCSVYFKRFVTVKTLISIILFFYSLTTLHPFVQKRILRLEHVKFNNIKVHQLAFNTRNQLIADTIIIQDIDSLRVQSGGVYNDLHLASPDMKVATTSKMELGISYSTQYVLSVGKSANTAFTLLFILSIPVLWIVVWFRLKEIQL